VKIAGDVERALERAMGIAGIGGVLIVKDDRVALAGDLPPLVRSADPAFAGKTFHSQ
jgi:ApbE superfamily uncharacterized protein (UPF0280 family)